MLQKITFSKKKLKFHETKRFFKRYVDFLHIPAWGGGRNLLLKYFLTSVTVTLPLLLESSFLKAFKNYSKNNQQYF